MAPSENLVTEKDGIDSSLSTSDGQQPIVHKQRKCCFVAVVVFICLVVIWGISLLPAIFYANRLEPVPEQPTPGTNQSNHTTLKPKYPCSEPLILNPKSHMCEPPCTWVTFSAAEDLALKFVDNFSITISLLGFVIILLTWIRIKQLRIFPHVIPLYIQGLSAAISLLLAIGNGMGREKAFCTSRFMREARESPTLFCTVQGVLIHYFSVALALWFVTYSINLTQMIFSDSVVGHKKGSFKRRNIVYSLICWLLPWIPVGIVLGSKSGYNVYVMRYCFPAEDMSFFTTTFITELAQAVGCTCLFAVVYKLFRLRDISAVTGKQAEQRKRQMNKVVIRLVCLMFAYAVCVILTYVPICALQRHSKLLKYHINKYFKCLMFFAPEFCPKTYEEHTFSATIVVSTLSTAFFALTTVCFLAFNKQSRKLWNFWCHRMKKCC